MYTITLLANPNKERLSQVFVDSMAAKLQAQAPPRWIKQGIACEFLTNHEPQITKHQSFDYLIQPHPKPHYKLLITDMDSTMIEQECIDELADFVGKKAHVSAITERAMNGELDFAEALTERVALLAGLPEAVLQQCFDERITLMPGARELVSHMKRSGAHTVLVSGGFTFFTSRVRAALGMDEDFSNTLEIKDGKLTGNVTPPILGKEAKLATLEAKCQELGISKDEVLAIGDGANDLPMLLAAGLGIAYHAKPTVRAQAKAQLNHSDLNAVILGAA